MNGKNLLHWELDKEKKASIQVKALRGLAAFLVLMILLTLLSRAADSVTIAKVTTSTVTTGTLTHSITAEGLVSANREVLVEVPDGLKIASVEVEAGQIVAEGDVLLTLDADDLAAQLSEAEYELAVFNAEQADKEANAAIAAASTAKAISRAKEDYATTVSEADATVSSAKSAYETAKSAYETAKAAYEEAKAAYEAQDATASEEEAAEADAASVITKSDLSTYKEEKEACYEAYTAAKDAYEEAKSAREQTIKEAARALEDATETTETQDTATELTTQKELETLQAAVEEIAALVELGGEITASASGMVVSVPVSAGETTSEATQIRIADQSAGYKFSASLEKASAKYLSAGDEITLSIGTGTTVSGLTIDSIEMSLEDSNQYNLTVYIPAKVTDISSFATMTVEKSTKKYDCCVPLSALHSDGDSYYIYALTETDTVLGTQTTVERVTVEVTDKDGDMAAVEGGVYRGLELVLSSTKTLRSGDRVKKSE